MSEVSEKVIKQRVRNRIIEVLDMFSNQKSVEKIGTDEISECWYDFVDVDEERFEYFTEPVFTKEETNAIKRFHNLLECLYDSIPTTWSRDDLINNDSWLKLESTAKEELEIFMARGFLDEENEIT